MVVVQRLSLAGVSVLLSVSQMNPTKVENSGGFCSLSSLRSSLHPDKHTFQIALLLFCNPASCFLRGVALTSLRRLGGVFIHVFPHFQAVCQNVVITKLIISCNILAP